jgi:hypothetical protein
MPETFKGPLFNIPPQMLQAFTMNGLARINVDWFYGDTSGETITWTKEFYQELKGIVVRAVKEYGNVYYSTDCLLAEIFDKYPITAKTVAVIGSATPLYEAYIEHFGGTPLTIEYRKINHNIDKMCTYTYEEAVNEVQSGTIKSDYAFCYSSIEHSGLGRYGDFLDPEGDFKTMQLVKNIVDPGGLFFLQIPVGQDALIWNNTRVYGSFRLLLLLEGWELVDSFGYSPSLLNNKIGIETECILVLRNSKSSNTQQKLFTNQHIESFHAMEEDRSIWQKKIKELSSVFCYQRSDNPRVHYTSPVKPTLRNKASKCIDYAFRNMLNRK